MISEENIENLVSLLQSVFVGMILLIVAIFLIFFVASKALREDFELGDYLTVGALIFMASSLSYILLSFTFLYLVEGASLITPDQTLLFRGGLFISFAILLFGPIFFALRETFMFTGPRLVVTLIYTIILSLILTIYV